MSIFFCSNINVTLCHNKSPWPISCVNDNIVAVAVAVCVDGESLVATGLFYFERK